MGLEIGILQNNVFQEPFFWFNKLKVHFYPIGTELNR